MSDIHLPRFAQVPGLLVTATDTEVGKTVVTCAILQALSEMGHANAAGFKPFASGCRREGGQLVNDDALAIQAFAGLRMSLDQVNPVRYEAPLAPGVAAEQEPAASERAWQRAIEMRMKLADEADCLVVEGVGGLLVPLDETRTLLDFATTLQYPAVVVARSTLGTLNHTAMTIKILRDAECPVAGIVINGFDSNAASDDPSIKTNRKWLERMTGAPVLAVLPKVSGDELMLHGGRLPDAIMQPIRQVDWQNVIAPPARLEL